MLSCPPLCKWYIYHDINQPHGVSANGLFFSTTFSFCYLTLNDWSNILWFICMQFSSSLGTVVPHWCRWQIGTLSKTEHKWCREERLLHASRTCFLGNFRTYKTVIASFGSRTQSLRETFTNWRARSPSTKSMLKSYWFCFHYIISIVVNDQSTCPICAKILELYQKSGLIAKHHVHRAARRATCEDHGESVLLPDISFWWWWFRN